MSDRKRKKMVRASRKDGMVMISERGASRRGGKDSL